MATSRLKNSKYDLMAKPPPETTPDLDNRKIPMLLNAMSQDPRIMKMEEELNSGQIKNDDLILDTSRNESSKAETERPSTNPTQKPISNRLKTQDSIIVIDSDEGGQNKREKKVAQQSATDGTTRPSKSTSNSSNVSKSSEVTKSRKDKVDIPKSTVFDPDIQPIPNLLVKGEDMDKIRQQITTLTASIELLAEAGHEMYVRRAERYVKIGNFESASKDLNKALKLEPLNPDAIGLKFYILSLEKKFIEAERLVSRDLPPKLRHDAALKKKMEQIASNHRFTILTQVMNVPELEARKLCDLTYLGACKSFLDSLVPIRMAGHRQPLLDYHEIDLTMVIKKEPREIHSSPSTSAGRHSSSARLRSREDTNDGSRLSHRDKRTEDRSTRDRSVRDRSRDRHPRDHPRDRLSRSRSRSRDRHNSNRSGDRSARHPSRDRDIKRRRSVSPQRPIFKDHRSKNFIDRNFTRDTKPIYKREHVPITRARSRSPTRTSAFDRLEPRSPVVRPSEKERRRETVVKEDAAKGSLTPEWVLPRHEINNARESDNAREESFARPPIGQLVGQPIFMATPMAFPTHMPPLSFRQQHPPIPPPPVRQHLIPIHPVSGHHSHAPSNPPLSDFMGVTGNSDKDYRPKPIPFTPASPQKSNTLKSNEITPLTRAQPSSKSMTTKQLNALKLPPGADPSDPGWALRMKVRWNVLPDPSSYIRTTDDFIFVERKKGYYDFKGLTDYFAGLWEEYKRGGWYQNEDYSQEKANVRYEERVYCCLYRDCTQTFLPSAMLAHFVQCSEKHPGHCIKIYCQINSTCTLYQQILSLDDHLPRPCVFAKNQ